MENKDLIKLLNRIDKAKKNIDKTHIIAINTINKYKYVEKQ